MFSVEWKGLWPSFALSQLLPRFLPLKVLSCNSILPLMKLRTFSLGLATGTLLCIVHIRLLLCMTLFSFCFLPIVFHFYGFKHSSNFCTPRPTTLCVDNEMAAPSCNRIKNKVKADSAIEVRLYFIILLKIPQAFKRQASSGESANLSVTQRLTLKD